MVKRKSLKFLSIALAVVVVGSALYYGTSKYISADVESDGEWAYVKNPTFDERRSIVFDAYISNRSSNENTISTVNNLYVIDEDLKAGKITKIPVDAVKRYVFWQNYWSEVTGRKPALAKETGETNVAFAAESGSSLSVETKNKLLGYIAAVKDNDKRALYQYGLTSIIARSGTGSGSLNINDIPDITKPEELGSFLEKQAVYGSIISSKILINATSERDYNSLTDKGKYNKARLEFVQALQETADSDQVFPDNVMTSVFFNYYLSKSGNVPLETINVQLVKNLVEEAKTLSVAAHNDIVAAGGYSSDSVSLSAAAPTADVAADPAIAQITGTMRQRLAEEAGSQATDVTGGTATPTSILFDWIDEEMEQAYNDYFNSPEWLGTLTYEVVSPIDAGDGEDATAAEQEAIRAQEANAATMASVAQTEGVVHPEGAISAKLDENQGVAPVSSRTATTDTDVKKDEVKGSSMVNAGWSGVGTVGINPNTGRFEYRSAIEYNGTKVGYMSFDPANARTDAQLHYAFSGKEVSLYAEPTTGDIYLEVGSTNGDPLYAIGETIDSYEVRTRVENGKTLAYIETVPKKVNGLMSVIVAKDGSIGGSFRYMNRVFNYNPNSKAFEIPINIDSGFKVGDNTGSKTIYLDSKGGVRGNISVVNSGPSTGNLYFTRTGTIGFTYNYAELDSAGKAIGSLGGVSIDSTGSIAGTVNAGKLTGLKTNLFIGFDNTGISSVSVPIGNIAGNAVGFTYSKDGIALGSFINLGVPIPISLAQDRYGGWTLSLPFIGSILKLGQNVDESPDPPAPKLNEDGSIDLNYIHIARYETSRWFKTYRFYQVQPVKLSKEEMFERSQIIFDKYNEHLKRNPSIEEFIHWYIYWGHMKIGWECRVMDDEGHQNRVRQLKGALDGLITQNSWHLPEGAEFLDKNKPEYECIKSGTEPTKCKDRPENILGYNPISDEAEGNAESDTDYDSIKEFLDYIEQLAKTDPEIERIIQEFINNHEENPTTGLIGDGETVRFTNGFNTFVVPEYDQVVLKEISNLASATVTVTPTMTASGSVTATETASSMPTLTAVKSARLAYIDTAPFINKGLEIFQYNGASANKWLSTANGDSIPYMKAGIGYYIYNPGTTVGVEIQKADIAETASLKPSLQKGWNLVANSGEKSLNLDEIKHSIVAGNDKTLVEMAKADEIYNRMYLIQDGTAIEATKAFRLLNPLATDTTQQIVGVLKPYWVYVK